MENSNGTSTRTHSQKGEATGADPSSQAAGSSSRSDVAKAANSGPIGGSNSAENIEAALDEGGGVIQHLISMIEDREMLDELADKAQSVARQFLGEETASILQGEWLGHAVHPMLTDLPIGFWTSGMTLDLLGGRKGRKMAKRLIGLGVLTALPTAAAGMADFTQIEVPENKRVAAVHMVGNTAALGMFTMSWWKRTRGHHMRGMMYSAIGAVAATASGALGGHLVLNPAEADESSQAEDHDAQQSLLAGTNLSSSSGEDSANPTALSSDDYIDLSEAADRLGQPPEQVMALSVSGVLPNRSSNGDQPRFRVQDVEAARLMGG